MMCLRIRLADELPDALRIIAECLSAVVPFLRERSYKTRFADVDTNLLHIPIL